MLVSLLLAASTAITVWLVIGGIDIFLLMFFFLFTFLLALLESVYYSFKNGYIAAVLHDVEAIN